MENEDKNLLKYYHQFKSYFISNLKLLDIFKNSKEKESKCDWSEVLFRAINRYWIEKWKEFIGYDNICQELKKKNINIIKDDCKKVIISLIKDNIKDKKKKFEKLDNSLIYGSLLSSTYQSLNNSNNINTSLPLNEVYPSKNIFDPIVIAETNFDLVSKEAWDLFDEDKDNEKNNRDGKIPIKIGKNKIIIKFKEDLYIIQYPNSKIKEITDLEKDLIQLKVKVYKGNPEEFVKVIFNKVPPIKDFNEVNKYYGIGDNITLHITKKEIEKVNEKVNDSLEKALSNISSIKADNNESTNIEMKKFQNITHKSLDKDNLNINLQDVHYINKIIVRKLNNTTYVIASMYSLSQIKEFAEYFFINEKNNKKDKNYSKVLCNFRDYINQLWIEQNQNYLFEPKAFMKSLNEYDKNIFDFKDEKEPIIFLKEIFNYINKELNNKDKDLQLEIQKSFDKILNVFNFANFMKVFINNFNSIISKVFYGVILQQYTCESCNKKKQIFEKLDILELNYNNYYNYKNELNNSSIKNSGNSESINDSFVNIYLDDFINYYFEQQSLGNINICNCDKSKIKIERKIYKFPETLIIYINWGKFSKDEGFGFDSNKLIFGEEIDLTKYNFNNNNINNIKYKIRSVIYYPVINIDNKNDRKLKKFITSCRHLVDQNIYFYSPSGEVILKNRVDRVDLIPSILFFEKEE